MSESNIDVGVFDPSKLKKTIADINADPNLSEAGREKLYMDIAIIQARHAAIAEILGPLTEAYSKDRRRKDPKYDLDDDHALKNTRMVALGEMRRLMDELDKLVAVRLKLVDAKIARLHLQNCAFEFLKLVELMKPPEKRQTPSQWEGSTKPCT